MNAKNPERFSTQTSILIVQDKRCGMGSFYGKVMVALAALMAVMILAAPIMAGPVSSDGLELVYFNAGYNAGPNRLAVALTLKNVSGHPIVFGQAGVFVGARWNSTTDANNRDFGHKSGGSVLAPGQSIDLKAVLNHPSAGTWRLWPAYSTEGHWGPFRWNEKIIAVPERPAPRPRPR
ncbi:MAG: hypothetical protein JXR89_03625 [Deltaproteobacteria bacterium]|nr:hypothetical protein [Deltaproteobacteria bacterium]